MEYLIPLGCMGLLLGLVLYVGYPLFTTRQQTQALSSDARSRQLQERKEQLYADIRELEFDQDLGKLSAEDYQGLRSQLETEALAVIQQLDQMDGRPDAEALQERIEREVLALRTEQPADSCPSCQAARDPKDLFCSQCGTRFEEQS